MTTEMEKLTSSLLEAASTDTQEHPKNSIDVDRAAIKRRESVFEDYIRQRGTRYRDCRLNNFEARTHEQVAVVEKLTSWITDGRCGDTFTGKNLVFIGPVGTGKDHLLTASLRGLAMCDFFKEGQGVTWENGSRLFARFRDGIEQGTGEVAGRSEYTSCRLLCLSDLCRAGKVLTDFQQQVIYDILDRRYSFNRPTWISINARSRGEMETMFGCDVVDRLMEDATLIHCVWDSYRSR